MKRRFVLPAAFALTLLAFLLFGFAKSAVRALPEPKPVVTEVVFVRQAPELPPDLENGETASAKAALLPSQPEPLNRVDSLNAVPFQMPRPEATIARPTAVLTIDPGIFRTEGDSDGHDGGGVRAIDATLLDNRPRARTQRPPVYPSAARMAGVSGEVVVEFVVDRTGRVLGPRIVRSTDPRFDEPTLQAVSKWLFEPGMKSGRPVSFRMIVPVRYSVAD